MPPTHPLRFIPRLLVLAVCLAGCAAARPGLPPAPATPNRPVPAAATLQPVSEERPELGKFFQGNTGAFVLYDLRQNRLIRYAPARCASRFIPASTFKVLNALIGLESGVIPDENYVIPWDGTPYPIPAWNQDNTLKTAVQDSVVWYFQELARRVGQAKMQAYVNAAHYGNQDISGQLDSFWLDGALRISADEQVEFLKRFYQGTLPFSKRSLDIVRSILVLEQTGAYTLSGKTGSAQRVTPHVGWFVGYLETSGNVYFFATNYESPGPDGLENGDTARAITRSILQSLGLLP
jgi:beta-lactamase class D